MTLTRKNIGHIAHLTRLEISDTEAAEYMQQLSDIIDFIGQIDNVDTQNIEPMAHPIEITQRLREDLVTEVDQHKTFQALASQVETGYYCVPKVIE